MRNAGCRFIALAAAAAIACAACGCGYVGIAGIIYKLASEGEDRSDSAPSIRFDSAVGISPYESVTLTYDIVDSESDRCDVSAEYSTDGGATFTAVAAELSGTGSEGLSDLSSSPSGAAHVFVWDAAADVTGYNVHAIVRLTPVERPSGRTGSCACIGPFTLFANTPPSASVSAPQGNPGGRIAVAFTLSDADGDPADVSAHFSLNQGASWTAADRSGGFGLEGLSALTASPSGISHVFFWESYANLGPGDFQVVFRISPKDATSGETGTASSQSFTVYNSRPFTVAGSGTNPMGRPVSCSFDSNGVLYFAEHLGHRVWAFNPTASTLTAAGIPLNPGCASVVAGTGSPGFDFDSVPGSQASLDSPLGIAADSSSPPDIYIADSGNHRIRRVDGGTGFITTVCGTGVQGGADDRPAFLCELDTPEGVCCDPDGNLFVADTGNNAIRFANLGVVDKPVAGVTILVGLMKTVAGQIGAAGGFNGDGGSPLSRLLDQPCCIVSDSVGNPFFCDRGNARIRVVGANTGGIIFGSAMIYGGSIGTVAGGGSTSPGSAGISPASALLLEPSGLFLKGNSLFFSDSLGHALVAVNGSPSFYETSGGMLLAADRLQVFAGTWGTSGSGGDGGDSSDALLDAPAYACISPSGAAAFADAGGGIRVCSLSQSGGASVRFASLTLGSGEIGTGALPDNPGAGNPSGLDAYGTSVFFTDSAGHRILEYDSTTGGTSVLAGSGTAGTADGPLAQAAFSTPSDIAVASSGLVILVADSGSGRLRVVNLGADATLFGENVVSGEVATVTAASSIVTPAGIGFSKPYRTGDLFVADSGGHRIWIVSSIVGSDSAAAGDGSPGFVDGPAAAARFNSPSGVAVDSTGQILAVADTGNHAVRIVNLSAARIEIGFGTTLSIEAGEVGTLAGTGSAGFEGDGMLAWNSPFNAPRRVDFDLFRNVFVSDSGNSRIRKVTFSSGFVSTVAGAGPSGFNGDGLPAADTWLDGPEGLALDQIGCMYLAEGTGGRVRRFVP